MNRRQFIKGTLAAAFLAGTYSVGVEPRWLKFKETHVRSPHFKGHEPLKIVALADLHVGSYTMTPDRVREIVRDVNELKPDLIMLLGDYLASAEQYKHFLLATGHEISATEVADSLKGLKSKFGIYAVIGNHDNYRLNRPVKPENIGRELSKNGVTILENDALVINRAGKPLVIAGVADDRANPSFDRTFRYITTGIPTLLMAHDPGTFSDLAPGYAQAHKISFMAAGHTHGNQVSPLGIFQRKLPNFFNVATRISRAPHERVYGEYKVHGVSALTSSGIGIGPPVRFGCRPEVNVITISG